jgi:hypothetical protein
MIIRSGIIYDEESYYVDEYGTMRKGQSFDFLDNARVNHIDSFEELRKYGISYKVKNRGNLIRVETTSTLKEDIMVYPVSGKFTLGYNGEKQSFYSWKDIICFIKKDEYLNDAKELLKAFNKQSGRRFRSVNPFIWSLILGLPKNDIIDDAMELNRLNHKFTPYDLMVDRYEFI